VEFNGNTLPTVISIAAVAFTGVVRWAVGNDRRQLERTLRGIDQRLTTLDKRIYELSQRVK